MRPLLESGAFDGLLKPLIGAGILMVLGVALQLLGGKQKQPRIRSSGLMLLLTGYFAALTLTLWKADHEHSILGVVLIASAMVLFRVLATFESPGSSQ